MREEYSKEEYDKICEKNWEKRKEIFTCLNFFQPYFENKKLIPEIDKQKLLDNLTELYTIQENPLNKFCYVSSCKDDWIPDRIVQLWNWITGLGIFSTILDSLGMEIAKLHRRDLLDILAKAGDLRAKQKKVRTKLPKELIGKTLIWEKLEKNEWLVKVSPEQESECEYENQYNVYLKDIYEKNA